MSPTARLPNLFFSPPFKREKWVNPYIFSFNLQSPHHPQKANCCSRTDGHTLPQLKWGILFSNKLSFIGLVPMMTIFNLVFVAPLFPFPRLIRHYMWTLQVVSTPCHSQRIFVTSIHTDSSGDGAYLKKYYLQSTVLYTGSAEVQSHESRQMRALKPVL